MWLVEAFRVSKQRACTVIGLGLSPFYWLSKAEDQGPLVQRLRELAAALPRFGYSRIRVLLRLEGWRANIKGVYGLSTIWKTLR